MSKFSKLNHPGSVESTMRKDAYDFQQKRNRALQKRSLIRQDKKAIAILDGSEPTLSVFVASNSRAKLRLVKRLGERFKNLFEADPTLRFAHVTIIDQQHETSDEHTCINLRTITRQARQILDRIGPNYTAAVELAIFANRGHPLGGKIISPHVHAVVWGFDDLRATQQAIAGYNARMVTGVAGCVPVRVQPVRPTLSDLQRVVAYPYRDPSRSKSVYHNPRTGRTNLHESEKGDRNVRYLRMFQLMSLLEQDRLCFARGHGVAIRRDALAHVHHWLEQHTPRAVRAPQMAWIEDFWLQLMETMHHTRFRTPIIVTR